MESTFVGHGWQLRLRGVEGHHMACVNTNGHLAIGHLPGRKQVALYQEQQACLRVLAYFRTEEDAQAALDFIDKLATKAGMDPGR